MIVNEFKYKSDYLTIKLKQASSIRSRVIEINIDTLTNCLLTNNAVKRQRTKNTGSEEKL